MSAILRRCRVDLRRLAEKRRQRRRLLLVVDFPAEDSAMVEETVTVRGWVHASGGVDRVDVVVNQRRVRWPVQRGIERRDVADALAEPGAERAGWSTLVPPADLVDGENVVRVLASASGGRTHEVERRFQWRRLRSEEVPYHEFDVRSERFDPRDGLTGALAAEHHARYRLAGMLGSGRRVLDAGCGTGYGAQAMLRAGAKTVDAVDSNVMAIAIAEREIDPRVRCRVGDVRSLPYADASFDVVVCFEVAQDILEPTPMVDELHRVTARGGIVIVSVSGAIGGASGRSEPRMETYQALLSERFEHVVPLRQQTYVATLIGAAPSLPEVAAPDPCPASLVAVGAGGSDPGGLRLLLATNGPVPEFEPFVALGDPQADLASALIGAWRERAIRAELATETLRRRVEGYQRTRP